MVDRLNAIKARRAADTDSMTKTAAKSPEGSANSLPETAVQATVPREALWAVARAADVFHRRAKGGRMDGKYFLCAAEQLERALARIPDAALR